MILKISTEKKLKKKGSLQMGNGMGEHVERDSLIVLDDVSGFADRFPSFVTFMTARRKFFIVYCSCFTTLQ